jgi:tellurite resistance protein
MPVRARRIPPNFFGFAFGLAGLAEVWLLAANQHRAPAVISAVLAAVACVVWLAVTVAYLNYLTSDRQALWKDLCDPVVAPFLSLAVIAPMILAVVGVYPHAASAGRGLFNVFLVLTLLLGGWFTGQWIVGQLNIDQIHPGYFLPTVAGGLIASDGSSIVGEHRLAEVMFGFGVISWLVIGSIVLGRLFTRPMLPRPLLPTLAIEVAPAAVASLAWFDANGDRIDGPIAIFAGYGLLMIVVQLRLLPVYLRLPFMPSTWAFTFSWAAVAAATLHWLADTRPAGYQAWQYLVVAAITVLVAAIAVRTVVALVQRTLLPAAPPGERAPEPSGAP